MFSALAMPASMTSVGFGAVPPHTASSLASASSSRPGSRGARPDLAPAREAGASVIRGQAPRFCLERPKREELSVCVAMVVKIGEILEDDGVGDVEQRALTVEQLPLDGGPVVPEKGADALKRLAGAVQRKKRGGRTVAASPAAGLARAGGIDPPGDEQRAMRPSRSLMPRSWRISAKPGIAEGLEAQALAADRVRGLVLQGIEGDGGDVGLARLFLRRFAADPPGPEPGDDVLGSAGTSGAASSSGGRPWSSASARAVTSVHFSRGIGSWGPKLSSVLWRTLLPTRWESISLWLRTGLPSLSVWGLGALMYRARAKGWRCVARTRAPARVSRGISTQRQSPGPIKDFRTPTSII